MAKNTFLKKTILTLLLISSFFFSIFATSCQKIIVYNQEDYTGKIFFDEDSLSFIFKPTRDFEQVDFNFILYHEDTFLFKKYNKAQFAEITRTMYDVKLGEDYLIQYELETDLYPGKIISDVGITSRCVFN